MVLCDSRSRRSTTTSSPGGINNSSSCTTSSPEDASLKLLTIQDVESSNFLRLTVVAAAHETASNIIHSQHHRGDHLDSDHVHDNNLLHKYNNSGGISTEPVEETFVTSSLNEKDFEFKNNRNTTTTNRFLTSSSVEAAAPGLKASAAPSTSTITTTTTALKETSLPLPQQASSPAARMSDTRTIEFVLKSLLSGGVAGMCAKTAVAPLDRIKILLQAHSNHYKHLGVFSGLKGIVEKERFLALYKGNGAQMVRIFPYAATQFTSYEAYKKLFGEKSRVGNFFAGSAAGVTAVALTYPLDTIRARLAFQVSGEHVYNGIYSCAISIFKDEGGVRALYRGFTPTVCGMVPYAGLSFYCFESFKYFCMKYFPGVSCSTNSRNTGGLELLIIFKLLCGGVAGAVAQSVSYPLDVTRRRMQLAMMNESTRKFGMGMFQTLRLIYTENGVWRGLYRGMSINYLRAIPMVAVSFTTYELVKQLLNMDTGLAIKTG